MADDKDRSIYEVPIGTLEDAQKLLGVKSDVNFAPHPVTVTRIAQFCSVIEDGNPAYWDEVTSAEIWGKPIAPPAMIQIWTLPLPWTPIKRKPTRFMQSNLPLPGNSMINVSTDIVYHRPVYVGENIIFWDEAVDISPEKETRLGVGHFVTTVGHYQTVNGEEVATGTNVVFRFSARDKS